jgi:serine/threonine-protein kinase
VAVPLEDGDMLATRRVGGGEVAVHPSQAAVRPLAEGHDSDGTSDGGREQRLPQVAGYDILGILGHGGMGVVYRARQRSLDRYVALKMIRDAHLSAPDELLRFRAEALAVAQLTHPHIIQIHEIGEHDGLPYISLELVEGGTLDDWLGDRPQPIQDAAAFIEKIARAVQVAHARGLMHRDLKPANLLLDWGEHVRERTRLSQATPKIADFGLVKRIDSTEGLTLTGQVLGTPSYMAPEQANPSAGAVGPWTDVYALGAILYELLTGRPPFLGPTGMDTLRLVLEVEPVPLRRLRREVPADLETIVLKCLAKDPRRRYLSAEELAEDLRRFQAGEPIQARPVSLLARLSRRVQRNPVVAGLGGVLALVLLGVLGAVLFLIHQDREHRRLGSELIGKLFQEVTDLEDKAQNNQQQGDPNKALIEFDKALAKLLSAEEHLRRMRDQDLWALETELEVRLVGQREETLAVIEKNKREDAFVRALETVRLDLLGVELDGGFKTDKGRSLRRVLIDNGIPVGQVAPAELVAAVRARPRIQREILDALVECYLSSLDEKEATDLLSALDTLDDNPDAHFARVCLLKEPENLLDANNVERLERLPLIYTIATSVRLAKRNNYEGATRLLRRAIIKKPDEFWLHLHLGFVLQARQPQAPGASLAAFSAAYALRPGSGHALTNLGLVLMKVGRQEEGLACLEKACQMRPDFASYHANLGVALRAMGQNERARTELQQAIDLNKNEPHAHVEMALLELHAGNFVEATSWYRKAIALMDATNPLRTTYLLQLQLTQKFRRLDGKLSAVLEGTARPGSVLEAGDLIQLCYLKGKYLDAYRLSKRYFAEYPGLEATRGDAWFRFNAACFAAQAACGKGDGAVRLSPEEKVALRADALRWLQAEMTELKRLRDTGLPLKQVEVTSALQEWLTDAALAGVRERGWIDTFPTPERKAWLELWAEVDAVLEKLAQDGR